MLAHKLRRSALGEPVTVAYLASRSTSSLLLTHTYTGVPLGDQVDRWIIIAWNNEQASPYSSGSVGGEATSVLYDAPSSPNQVKWLKAKLTSAVGTTGTVSITFTGAGTHAVFGFWVVYGDWNGLPYGTEENIGGAVLNPSVTADVPNNAYMLAAARNTSGTNFGTITNATERFDVSTGSGQMVLTGGDYINTSGSLVSRTITFSSADARASGVVIRRRRLGDG